MKKPKITAYASKAISKVKQLPEAAKNLPAVKEIDKKLVDAYNARPPSRGGRTPADKQAQDNYQVEMEKTGRKKPK